MNGCTYNRHIQFSMAFLGINQVDEYQEVGSSKLYTYLPGVRKDNGLTSQLRSEIAYGVKPDYWLTNVSSNLLLYLVFRESDLNAWDDAVVKHLSTPKVSDAENDFVTSDAVVNSLPREPQVCIDVTFQAITWKPYRDKIVHK